MNNPPGVARIIATDPILQFVLMLLAACVGIVLFGWIAYAVRWAVPVHSFEQPPGLLKFLALVIPELVLLGGPAAWWITTTRRTFALGESHAGQITSIKRIRGAVVVDYTFSMLRSERTGRAFSSENRRLRKVKAGDRVSVIARPNTPHVSFVRELYFETLP